MKRKLQAKSLNNTRKILNNILNQNPPQNSTQQPPKTQYFQSFSYTDHITNIIFSLDSSNSYLNNQISNSSTNNNNNNNKLSCYSLMKSTRNFHLNSIRQKNYKINDNVRNCDVVDLDEIRRGKVCRYRLRKNREREKYERDKLEFQRIILGEKDKDYNNRNINACMSLPISPRLQNEVMQKSTHQIFNKQFMQYPQKQENDQNSTVIVQNQDCKLLRLNPTEQIIKQFQRTKLQENGRKKKKLFHKKVSEIGLNYQNLSLQQLQLVQKLNGQIRRQVTKNAQYLVKPNKLKFISVQTQKKKMDKTRNKQSIPKQHHHGLFRRARLKNLNSMKKIKNQQQYNPSDDSLGYKDNFLSAKQQISDMSFKLQNQDQLIRKYKLKINKKSQQKNIQKENQLKQMINSIKIGNYFKIQINLSLKPELLKLKQHSTGNNLLHLCIKFNQPQIFRMIVKKSKQINLDLLNQHNKFKKTPKQLKKIDKAFYQLYQKSKTIQIP